MEKTRLHVILEMMSDLNGIVHQLAQKIEENVEDVDCWPIIQQSMELELEISKQIEEISEI